jgi:hypothetical protein
MARSCSNPKVCARLVREAAARREAAASPPYMKLVRADAADLRKFAGIVAKGDKRAALAAVWRLDTEGVRDQIPLPVWCWMKGAASADDLLGNEFKGCENGGLGRAKRR